MKAVLVLLMILFISACKASNSSYKTGKIQEVYNTATPSRGTIELAVTPVLEISSKSVPLAKGTTFFNGVKKDSKGNLFFFDGHSICIHKSNPRGEYLKSFLRKGDGPGELSALEGFTIINDVIYCSNRLKYCCFDAEGNLIKNVQLATQHNGIIEHVDTDRYITYQNIYDGNKNVGSRCLLVDVLKGETELYRKMIANIGYSVLKLPHKDFLYITETTPRIQYRYNPVNKLIYCFYNFDYSVSLIDLNGNVKRIVNKKHARIRITDEELSSFAESYKRQGWTPLHIDVFMKHPPEENWPAIRNIRMLANGYWGTIRTLAVTEQVMDVFNADGEFQYVIKENDKIENIEMISFFKNGIGIISLREDGDFFNEYKVIHPPQFLAAADIKR